MKKEQLEAIRERSENGKTGGWHAELMNAREDIPALLAEVERLRREIAFVAHVDLLRNAYNAEHIAVSVKSWALNVLDGVNHDGK